MLKKLFIMLISVICGIYLVVSNGNTYIGHSTVESSSSVPDSENDNDDSPSEAIKVIVVLAVFTITCVSTAVITYKLRRKIYINFDNDESKHSNL